MRVSGDGITVLTLPAVILADEIIDQIHQLLAKVTARSHELLALVIASSHPKIFLAGAHLAEIAALDSTSSRSYALAGRRLMNTINHFPLPVVAAVGGACAGGGLDLVLACDNVVLGPDARLAHPGVRRGLVTGWGGTWRLPAAVGTTASRRALLEAEAIPHEALSTAGMLISHDFDPVSDAVKEAKRLAALHPFRLKWHRSLKRGRFIDRFRTSVIHQQGTN